MVNYLVHPHDSKAVRAANFLETLGAGRHQVGVLVTDMQEMVLLISGQSPLLKECFHRTLRLPSDPKGGNADTLGIPIPEYVDLAKPPKAIFVINADRVGEKGFEDALRQLHYKVSGIRPQKKKRSRSNRGSRSSDFGRYSIMG